jgi:hypothetical protein
VAYHAATRGGGWMQMRQVLAEIEGGCSVSLAVRYELPGGRLGRLVGTLYVDRRNEREAERSLQNLKLLAEGRGSRS